jgi:hypothetical protein
MSAMSLTTEPCSCGEPDPHVVARRVTEDGVFVEIWSDGAITGRAGSRLPGLRITRARSAPAHERARRAAWLVGDEVCLYGIAELPRLVLAARRVAARGGTPAEVRRAYAAMCEPRLVLTWNVYQADRDGRPVVRVAKLDRMRWPGMVIWHEAGRYEIMLERRGSSPSGHRLPDPVLESTGLAFRSQRALRAYLFAELERSRAAAPPTVEPRVAGGQGANAGRSEADSQEAA